eukprot:3613454-Lingulodinium_polyedra.AAC.1
MATEMEVLGEREGDRDGSGTGGDGDVGDIANGNDNHDGGNGILTEVDESNADCRKYTPHGGHSTMDACWQ